MNSLLSLITFLPLIGAVVLLLFLRGEDALAQTQRQAAGALHHDGDLRLSLFVLARFDPANTGFQFVEERPGSAGSPTRWASTASRCCSSC